VAAVPAQVPPHLNDDPSFSQTTNLTAVAAMPLHPQSSTVARQIARIAYRIEAEVLQPKVRPHLARSSRAEVLDGNRKAV